jgi:hypothetical protein
MKTEEIAARAGKASYRSSTFVLALDAEAPRTDAK